MKSIRIFPVLIILVFGLVLFDSAFAQARKYQTISPSKITGGRTPNEKVYEFVLPANQWVQTTLLINSNQEVMIHHFASNERVTVNLGGVSDSRLQKAGTILPLYTSSNCSSDPGVKARVTYYCRQISGSESVKLYARRSVRVGIAVKNRSDRPGTNETVEPRGPTDSEARVAALAKEAADAAADSAAKVREKPGTMSEMKEGVYFRTVSPPSSTTRMISAGPLISFRVPQNWKEFSGQGVAAFAPEGAYGKLGVSHGVVVGCYPKIETLQEATENLVKRNLKASKTFSRITGPLQMTIDGQAALVTTLSGKGEITGRIENADLYTTTLPNGWTFYIICVAPQIEIDRYEPVFNDLIDSFRLRNGDQDRIGDISKSSVTQLSSEAREFSVLLGKTVNGFNFSRRGALTYNGKRFSPAVIVNARDINKFEISMLTQRKMAGAIAADVYGQNKLFFLDTAKMTATPMQKRGEWNAAQKIYWSPSQRYMVALCAYEGESFVRIDTRTKIVRDVGVSYTEPGNNYETMLRISDEPRWSGSKDVLIFNVNKFCNPYEGNCGNGDRKVLARYKISLNVATLKMTYGRP